ncbi:hypothetical protein TRFO_26326 [Tritrichomonas foetus]|uniref:Tetraspanin family protein n=1 Tax=Tritrichomonas foetus TaxID=1144522 RepID=A0A1J4K806_9EUKA|nr:hypothetical protein TRFO_26326 [Tritrichomonas foetus]|eukprot:OHT05822.1 hypothetical protein TRFO_26326 [Tritrichomonas foetus]
MGGSILVTFFALVLISTIVVFTVMSGIGYSYFSDQIFTLHSSANLKVMFGCGIGVGIISFSLVWIYFIFPRARANYFFIFPPILIFLTSYLIFTMPSEKTSFVRRISRSWREPNQLMVLKLIQYQHECCGWMNYSDYGIDPCPRSYESGCEAYIDAFLTPRYNEIFLSSQLMLCLFVISVSMLTVYTLCTGSESIIENIILLNNIIVEIEDSSQEGGNNVENNPQNNNANGENNNIQANRND